jgi:hypothetical protein
MPSLIGLTTVKINGTYHLDVRNARWSTRRANQQHVTGGGVKQATGEEIPSGSFDEVVPKDKRFNWRAMRDFSIEILDKETRSKVVASFRECNWTGLDGSSDLGQANTTRAVTWNGSSVVDT